MNNLFTLLKAYKKISVSIEHGINLFDGMYSKY